MKEIPWKEVKNIVLLNLIANTVGDTMMVSPLITILKRHAPQAKIIVTASPQNATLLAGNPDMDELIPIPELKDIGSKATKFRKAIRYLSLMKRVFFLLRKSKPDVCFVLQPNFVLSQTLPWFAGIKYRIGYVFKGSRDFLLTHKTQFRDAYVTKDYSRHFREATLDILRTVNVPIAKKDALVRKWVNKEAEKWADDFLKSHDISSKDIIIAFQAGAKWASKQWPEENFSEVAFVLRKHKILLFGSSQEKELNERIAKRVGENAVLVIGEDLERVAALLKRCKLAFGNDSGLMHLASGVGTTNLILYGMSTPEYSLPQGPGKAISIQGRKYSDRPVLGGEDTVEGIERMKTITVKQALEAIKKVL